MEQLANHAWSAFEIGQRTGGGERDRTDDPLLAKQVLSQLSYTPEDSWWVWLGSNQRPPPYQDGALTSGATDPLRPLPNAVVLNSR